MINLLFSGGLGNQFFQYAAAKNLQLLINQPISYRYVSKTEDTHAERTLNIVNFNISEMFDMTENDSFFDEHRCCRFIYKVLTYIFRFAPNKIKRLLAKPFTWITNKFGLYIHFGDNYFKFYKPFSFVKEVYIQGMWHNEIYTKPLINTLRNELQLKDGKLKRIVENKLNQFKNKNLVCVHIRRGDYVKLGQYILCSADYYKKSFDIIKSKVDNPIFLIFSDDIRWCKENITGEEIVYMEDNNVDYIDFEIMKSCRHFIISNSTFSWWAAYLGYAPDKIVVTPKNWNTFRDKSWMNLDGWIEIDN